jgi:hypothetical protein
MGKHTAHWFTAEEKGKGQESEPQPQPSAEPSGNILKPVDITETEQTGRPSEPVADTDTSILHKLQKRRKEMQKLKQRERDRESRTRDSMVPDEANRSMLHLSEGPRDVNTRASQMPEAGYLHDRLVDDVQLGGGKPPDDSSSDSSSDSSDEGVKGKPDFQNLAKIGVECPTLWRQTSAEPCQKSKCQNHSSMMVMQTMTTLSNGVMRLTSGYYSQEFREICFAVYFYFLEW